MREGAAVCIILTLAGAACGSGGGTAADVAGGDQQATDAQVGEGQGGDDAVQCTTKEDCPVVACMAAICSAGVCSYAGAPDGVACEVGDLCHMAGQCLAGVCDAPKMDCDDVNACTDDHCEPGKGCKHTPNAGPCDDGKASTDGDHCSDGKCVPGEVKKEVCNGVDDDGDGLTDEEGASGCKKYHPDSDGDGYGAAKGDKCLCAMSDGWVDDSTDCDDEDQDIHPNAPELCDDKDNDCDKVTDPEGSGGCKQCYLDGDKDGFGAGKAKCECECGTDRVEGKDGDCDDGSAASFPGAVETCNGIDDDCDGNTDEEGALGCKDWFADQDGDGSGAPGSAKCLCGPIALHTADNGDDCDDSNKDIEPGAGEVCNGSDDDCDGTIDEEDALDCTVYYMDKDGDGWGSFATKKCLCKPDGPYSSTKGTDCNDEDALVHPDAEETCDQTDSDCDGAINDPGAGGCVVYYADADKDGWGDDKKASCQCFSWTPFVVDKGGDCNDSDPTIHPEAVESCNGKDDECNGTADDEGAEGCVVYYQDLDGDGFGDQGSSKCLCGPAAPFSVKVAQDCNDNDPAVNPSAQEACNGHDDDCDSSVDEAGAKGCAAYYPDKDGDGYGTAADSKCLCSASAPYKVKVSGDCNDNEAAVHPGALETCDAIDSDCDGDKNDEGSINCKQFFVDADSDTYGDPSKKKCFCHADAVYAVLDGTDCNDADKDVKPSGVETCNGKDDNCDGKTDPEGSKNCTTYYADQDKDGYGVTGATKCLCAGSAPYTATKGGDCADSDSAVHPGAAAICGKDSDCDGSALDPGEECEDADDKTWDGCKACKITEFQVNSYSADSQTRPVTGVYNNGEGFVVAWEGSGIPGPGLPAEYGVWARLYKEDGSPSTTDLHVNTVTAGQQKNPAMAIMGSQGFVVVWESEDQDGSGSGIYGQRYDSTGKKLGTEFQINTYTGNSQAEPRVASLDGSSVFVVVWESAAQDGSGWGVYGQMFGFDGTKKGLEFRVNVATTGVQAYPDVATYLNGFVVVWKEQSGQKWYTYRRMYAKDGAASESPSYVGTTNSAGNHPAVGGNPIGGFTIAWEDLQSSGIGSELWVRRYLADGSPTGSAIVVASNPASFNGPIAAAMALDGGFTISWATSAGTMVQRYSNGGAKQGAAIVANTFTGTVAFPGLAEYWDGPIVLAWSSANQDGSGDGVFAIRIGADGKKWYH